MILENQLLINETVEQVNGKKTIDLSNIVPIGKITKHFCTVSLSIDGKHFSVIKGDDANGEPARFIRIKANSTVSGTAAIYAGAGYVAQTNDYFTMAFQIRSKGLKWRGADGIFSFNITDGVDYGYQSSGRNTLFVFGDTLVSDLSEKGSERIEPVYMPNNTYVLIKGEDLYSPEAMQHCISTDDSGKPVAILTPRPECFPFTRQGVDKKQVHFWIQDGVVIDGSLYVIPVLITDDKTQPEGFQFKVLGTAVVRVPITGGKPDFDNHIQYPLEVYDRTADREILYGCGIMPHFSAAGSPNPDGYVYIYGYINRGSDRCLCVARVKPENFTDASEWRFFDGQNFVAGIRESAGLLAHVSCEMSISPIHIGKNKGKYLAVFQYDTNSAYVAVSVGETPWGPFSAAKKVYYCPEESESNSNYCYNAKAHPHLSPAGKLLVSYNVNNTIMQEHIRDSFIYRPRFIELYDTTISQWDLVFAEAYTQRTALFRMLNKNAVSKGIVFAGDSLIQEGPFEELLLENAPVYNRGIGGDTSEGLLRRVRESLIDLFPAKAFILIGTNDLAINGSTKDIAGNIEKIIRITKDQLPECRLFILSLLPVNSSNHPKINKVAIGLRANDAIREVNSELQSLCTSEKVKYIDLHSLLADRDGNLDLRYTREGLHLSPEGYQVMVDCLKSFAGRYFP